MHFVNKFYCFKNAVKTFFACNLKNPFTEVNGNKAK